MGQRPSPQPAPTALTAAARRRPPAARPQLELRILAHMAGCQSMIHAFELGGDFHSRTALGMYDHIKEAIAKGESANQLNGLCGSACIPAVEACGAGHALPFSSPPLCRRRRTPPLTFRAAEQCLLEWEGEGKAPLPLLKDLFASERRKAKVGAKHRPGLPSADAAQRSRLMAWLLAGHARGESCMAAPPVRHAWLHAMHVREQTIASLARS